MFEAPQRVDKANVQGLVLAPYYYRLSRHLFFSVREEGDGRRFLRSIVPEITHGAVNLNLQPPWLCNLGLTSQGLPSRLQSSAPRRAGRLLSERALSSYNGRYAR